MANKYFIYIIMAMLCELVYPKKQGCPPDEEMPRCVCDWPRGIHCNGIMNPQELLKVMSALSGYSVSTLRLNRAFLMYLPSGMFQEVPVKTLEIRKSEILGWETEDGSVMFEGAEHSLNTIRLLSVKGLTSWRWSVFSTLKNLETLHILRGELGHIGKDFSLVSPSLNQIKLEFCNIKHIHFEAFASHNLLTELSLEGNSVNEVKRSMFAKPAQNLKYLILDDNQLSDLPEDIFTEMPSLLKVSLKSNKIRHLSYDTFKPLAGRELSVLINDNDLYCCSDFTWITNANFQQYFEGNCKHPHIMDGKDIKSINAKDFKHGLC